MSLLFPRLKFGRNSGTLLVIQFVGVCVSRDSRGESVSLQRPRLPAFF